MVFFGSEIMRDGEGVSTSISSIDEALAWAGRIGIAWGGNRAEPTLFTDDRGAVA
jgi:hypothetical protein